MDKRYTGAGVAGVLLSTATVAQELKIDDLIVAKSIPSAQRDATIKAARTFYQFWNTGDESSLKAAIAPTFSDHTLPPGRPQGAARARLRVGALQGRSARSEG